MGLQNKHAALMSGRCF
uniref:Uncharacterized protein n=1 Tax=Arundo donax TaxID=35708 RepID=A0A0A9AVE2_ARUDO